MGNLRVSKWEWYERGGLSNPALFRRMRSGAWQYFVKVN
jgi:hypothetical protein